MSKWWSSLWYSFKIRLQIRKLRTRHGFVAMSCCDLDLQGSNPNLARDTLSQYGDHFCEIVLNSDFKLWARHEFGTYVRTDRRTTQGLYAPPNLFGEHNKTYLSQIKITNWKLKSCKIACSNGFVKVNCLYNWLLITRLSVLGCTVVPREEYAWRWMPWRPHSSCRPGLTRCGCHSVYSRIPSVVVRVRSFLIYMPS